MDKMTEPNPDGIIGYFHGVPVEVRDYVPENEIWFMKYGFAFKQEQLKPITNKRGRRPIR